MPPRPNDGWGLWALHSLPLGLFPTIILRWVGAEEAVATRLQATFQLFADSAPIGRDERSRARQRSVLSVNADPDVITMGTVALNTLLGFFWCWELHRLQSSECWALDCYPDSTIRALHRSIDLDSIDETKGHGGGGPGNTPASPRSQSGSSRSPIRLA